MFHNKCEAAAVDTRSRISALRITHRFHARDVMPAWLGNLGNFARL